MANDNPSIEDKDVRAAALVCHRIEAVARSRADIPAIARARRTLYLCLFAARQSELAERDQFLIRDLIAILMCTQRCASALGQPLSSEATLESLSNSTLDGLMKRSLEIDKSMTELGTTEAKASSV
jgi:hypothetical protein